MDIRSRHLLILGLGESGLAMARWCAHQGAHLRIADNRSTPPGLGSVRTALPQADIRTGPFETSLLDGIDLLALSPGLSVHEPIVVEAQRRGIAVTGEIELFVHALDTLGWRAAAKLIAITGTNGKTTTTSLVGAMCTACGLDSAVCGNISPAALDELLRRVESGRPPQVWVLELSSFQLETLQALNADSAAVLNLTEDHLDRYPDAMTGYARAKAGIFNGCRACVINRDDAAVAAMAPPAPRVLSFGAHPGTAPTEYGLLDIDGRPWLARGTQALLACEAYRLTGRHNALNALAALALCDAAGLALPACVDALRQFHGLPHRVEWVCAVDGVDFYDDSKGTNVGATLAAVEGMGRELCLILGGDGKGQDFAPLGPALATHARFAALIGRDAPTIAAVLQAHGVAHERYDDLPQATRACFAAARPGDAVLLSPACASLDMFRHYAHRAEVFIEETRRIQHERGAA